MQLTKGVEQAICIIVILSTQDKKVPLSSNEISKRLEVSPSYLKKIIRKLVVKRIITSVPGNNGGLSLAKSVDEIKNLEIIEAMEGPISMFPDTGLIEKAFKDGEYAEKGMDVLRRMFTQADELLMEFFSSQTVADLLKESFGTKELPTLNWNSAHLDELMSEKTGEKI
ncbi:Rrf2 family transcriptional regulator [Peribacillus muralis]|uniref:RrF2 family transcriptional regulator n=1 Tax=Peribacillus muralis TaxID=264697 RepID=UPI001F4E11FA|nr:Rrf2 family transcriptional regulator [Peribacillus muralis]MCK1994783.1 Rrf2 family transcriptional regulator [Peribacillus muralis]MCK2015390.1 Rrf2 family transcriptional regulator [Peribacillus muralis]